MDDSIESSPLYAIISFFVVWTDFIVRTYIRIKAVFDAIMYVAQKQPGKPTRSTTATTTYNNSEVNEINNNSNKYMNRSTTNIIKISSVHYLPNEVLQLIFKNESKADLYNYTLVCQRWHRVVTPLLWKDPILPFSSSLLMDPIDYCPSISSFSSSSTLLSSISTTDSSYDHLSQYSVTSSRSRRSSSSSSTAPSIISINSHQSHMSTTSSRRSSVIYNNQHRHHDNNNDHNNVALPMIILSLQYKKYGYSVRSLHLSSIAHLITDDILLYIIKCCPRLKSLDISNCQQLTSTGYQYLARSRFASSLTQLSLSNGPHLSDSALVALSMRCESLESIHLAGCHRITQNGVRSIIAASRKKLKYINIKDCIRVSGRILQDIAIICGSRLRGLDATRICSIFHHDVKVLVYHCPNIEQLYLGKNKSQLLSQLQQRIRIEQQQLQKDQLPFINKKMNHHSQHQRSPSLQHHHQQQNNNYIRSRTSSSLSTSLSSSLSSSLLHRQSRSSSLLTKPNALDSLIDMLRTHNVDPSPSSTIDGLHQPHPHQQNNNLSSDKLKQRTNRLRHLSQPTWNLEQMKNNNKNDEQQDDDSNHHQNDVSQLTVDLILKNLLNLKKVDFSYWTCLSEQGIRRLRQKGHTLQYIGLDGCSSVTQQPPTSSHKSGISDICKN